MTGWRRGATLLAGALLGLALVGAAAAQSASWLDGPPSGWNRAGTAVPAAPQTFGANVPRCTAQERAAVGAEEAAVAAAGWRLASYWPSQRDGELAVALATAGYDGMCRPAGFQGFVFVGGRYAGTLAPDPMLSRSDGALVGAPDPPSLRGAEGRVEARFVRYAPTDPLCCPSRGHTRVVYRVEREAAGPVVVPAQIVPEPPSAPTAPAPTAPTAPTQLPRTGGAGPWPAALGALLGLAGLWLLRQSPAWRSTCSRGSRSGTLARIVCGSWTSGAWPVTISPSAHGAWRERMTEPRLPGPEGTEPPNALAPSSVTGS
jgi:hypothetical protein